MPGVLSDTQSVFYACALMRPSFLAFDTSGLHQFSGFPCYFEALKVFAFCLLTLSSDIQLDLTI